MQRERNALHLEANNKNLVEFTCANWPRLMLWQTALRSMAHLYVHRAATQV